MGLNGLKWLILIIIFTVSIAAGLTTLHFANKHRKLVAMGEALANGIFVGAALFHLMPEAANTFAQCQHCSPYLYTIVTVVLSFGLLMLIEHLVAHNTSNFQHLSRVSSLLLTLSIHAFLTGLALGISNSYVVVISLLIAILAHKAFEVFALVINLRRQLKEHHHIRLLFFLFSFVTPLGILVGTSENAYLAIATGGLLTAVLNAVCAGTFLYIATIHAQHRHHPYTDGYQKYQQILATLIGMIIMGALAFWV